MDKTESHLSSVIDNVKHPLESEAYRLKCKKILDKEGVLVLKELLQPNIIQMNLRAFFISCSMKNPYTNTMMTCLR